MKNFCLIIFFVCGFSFAQNDIIGNWYLESFTIDGGTYNNVYNYISTIEFTTEDGLIDLLYNGGSTCNAYFGEYNVTNNIITINDLGMTAADCSEHVNGKFENLYFSILSDISGMPIEFNYIIEGSGNEQSLTLTKLNGDSIIYSKTNPEVVLHTTWYLQSISENGITYNISSTESPSLTLGVAVEPFFGTIPYSGTGNCNDFNGEYFIYTGTGDTISISNFTSSTNICDPASDFEAIYFSILGNENSNEFSFEITNSGDNLILTRITDTMDRSSYLTGTSLVFSKQPLSVEDHVMSTSKIAIVNNPADNQLLLNLDDSRQYEERIDYTIYSIDGKRVKSSVIHNETIDISKIKSGIYFISFVNNNQVLNTIRFVKK